MRIIPRIGVGDIQYGITEKDLIAIMGEPDRVVEEKYVEDDGDWHRKLWYSSRNITFAFDKEDNNKLGTITRMGSGYNLFGKDLFNTPKSLVRKVVSKYSNELFPVEDFTPLETGPHECLNSDASGIMFWFDSNNLSELQCSCIFESDNETVIWPSNHNASRRDDVTGAHS